MLILILAVDLGWKSWSERPYLVTGVGVASAGEEGRAYYVNYRVPGGGTGEWRALTPLAPDAFACWSISRIGSTIPTCMRSWNEISAGR
ncbi:MAG: hypothetical protein EPO16_07995 [Dehalococcoidia bacterium]|nr:MAG: hypothetical protein EPO16_07995 [Dehalococcoidia bacterium]